eukprot:Blabericola_migrator_1__11642@NODE_700_length_6820_cov_37_868651_g509_i0_p4_GENE_NODE_700_length_6820_cov_37_868651_g509_i0NODE_700_length_6820_cov_37_868651_g509_i0_p4_ORF_typecomplete_len238_score29_94MLANA/PF14991_6/4_5e03MLANA/PF14991_6/0_05DUF3169/PF11368_8/1_5e02DUF3169/PF11368_8/0_064_NODE_700_length_6820_cov_37_868651_g509_i010641777
MVIFIVEGGVLMTLMINMIKRYRNYEIMIEDDNKSSIGAPSSLSSTSFFTSMFQAEGYEMVPDKEHMPPNLLTFYGLRQRFNGHSYTFSSIVNKCDSSCEAVSFADYLSESSTALMVETLEIPVPSLLALLFATLLTRPIFTMFGLSFMIAISIITLYILLISCWFYWKAANAYQKCIPAIDQVKTLIQENIDLRMVSATDAALGNEGWLTNKLALSGERLKFKFRVKRFSATKSRH